MGINLLAYIQVVVLGTEGFFLLPLPLKLHDVLVASSKEALQTCFKNKLFPHEDASSPCLC